MSHFLKLICLLVILVVTAPVSAQEEQQNLPALRVMAGGGYLIGGQFFSESFTYNPAFSGDISVLLPLSSTVNIGVGTGATLLMEQERFIPFYLSFLGFLKPDQSTTYMLLNIGSSAAWRTRSAEFSDYNFNGGMMFKAGVGRRFLIAERASLLLGMTLQHQWATGSYANGLGLEYEENLNYDWLAIELRFFY